LTASRIEVETNVLFPGHAFGIKID